jgi:hypothetical protein
MKIMLDCSPRKIAEYSKKYNHDFWQLRTPLTNNKLAGVPYGLDNGCFSEFKEKAWLKLIRDAEQHHPVFITVPDIVGDAVRTLDLYKIFKRKLHGLPTCLVLQDGIGQHPIPWDELTAVFVGGTDKFKVSQEAMSACRVAKMLGKWVHVGRVNTISRAEYWKDIADSIDGSGVSRFDERLEEVLWVINGSSPQMALA